MVILLVVLASVAVDPVDPWSGVPGLLGGAVLSLLRRRVRWVVFAGIVLAAGAVRAGDPFLCALAVLKMVLGGISVQE